MLDLRRAAGRGRAGSRSDRRCRRGSAADRHRARGQRRRPAAQRPAVLRRTVDDVLSAAVRRDPPRRPGQRDRDQPGDPRAARRGPRPRPGAALEMLDAPTVHTVTFDHAVHRVTWQEAVRRAGAGRRGRRPALRRAVRQPPGHRRRAQARPAVRGRPGAARAGGGRPDPYRDIAAMWMLVAAPTEEDLPATHPVPHRPGRRRRRPPPRHVLHPRHWDVLAVIAVGGALGSLGPLGVGAGAADRSRRGALGHPASRTCAAPLLIGLLMVLVVERLASAPVRCGRSWASASSAGTRPSRRTRWRPATCLPAATCRWRSATCSGSVVRAGRWRPVLVGRPVRRAACTAAAGTSRGRGGVVTAGARRRWAARRARSLRYVVDQVVTARRRGPFPWGTFA